MKRSDLVPGAARWNSIATLPTMKPLGEDFDFAKEFPATAAYVHAISLDRDSMVSYCCSDGTRSSWSDLS